YFGATILLNLYFVGKALSQNVLQTSNDILAGSTGMPSWFLAGAIGLTAMGALSSFKFSFNRFVTDGYSPLRSPRSRRNIRIAAGLGMAASAGQVGAAILTHPVTQQYAPYAFLAATALGFAHALFDYRKVLKTGTIYHEFKQGGVKGVLKYFVENKGNGNGNGNGHAHEVSLTTGTAANDNHPKDSSANGQK
ncbi:MAG: hypothetical protein HQM16_19350, partial [Deltaproteobacteria bacterium]|nr:hypothetical protein [Deltaproteobacteria bacterium]